MTKRILAAKKVDVDLVNSIEPPVRGVHAGSGVHVVIPNDWAARIANGEDVPGCSYAKAQDDGSLMINDFVRVELMKPGREAWAARLVDLAVPQVEPLPLGETVRGKS